MKISVFKKKLIYLILAARALSLLSIAAIFILTRWLIISDLLYMLGILFPMTCFYFATAIKYAYHHRYAGQTSLEISKGHLAGFWVLSVLYVFQFLLELHKCYFNTIPNVVFFPVLIFLETVLGIYAGVHLSEIFAEGLSKNIPETSFKKESV